MHKIAIRTDGSPDIGMGHIMRCISLGKEFKRWGCTVFFFSKYSDGINKIRSEGFELIKIKNGKLNSLENEPEFGADQIIALVEQFGIDVLIIDSYNVSRQYFLQLKPYVKKLVYIDDINKYVYPVDILINGNITGEYMKYEKYSDDETMLLGPKYNLIRDEFKSLPSRAINKEVKEVMVTTGGSDAYNMNSKIVNMLISGENKKNFIINIVVGSAFKNKKQLENISKEHDNVVLHENVKRMSDIMLRSDIAISAGGSTLYELCACGTPTLAFIAADNQEELVNKMEELGYIQSLGWYNEIAEDNFAGSFKAMYNDYNRRLGLSKKMQSLVDAQGTRRIVEEVLESIK